MLRNVLLGVSLGLILLFSATSAQAFGVYADLPLNYTLKDCNNDCSYMPAGIKGGVVLPGNLVLGAENYKLKFKNSATSVTFNFADVAYLLPIPVVNLMVGAGLGNAKIDTGVNSYADFGTQLWASLGFPVVPTLDLHLGYHEVKAKVDMGAGNTVNLGGRMLSLGVLLNF